MVFQTYLNKKEANRAAMGLPRFQTQSTSLIRIFQFIVVLFSTFISATIVGASAHVFHTYKSQQLNGNPWWLPIWAGHFDTSGVKTTIGTASGVLLLNLVFLILFFVPRFKFLPKADALIAGGLSIPCILLSVGAIVVSTQINSRKNADTIQTWACRWKSVFGDHSTPSSVSNGDFGALCTESHFAYWGMVAVLGLEVALFGSSLIQWIFAKRSNRSIVQNEKVVEEYSPQL